MCGGDDLEFEDGLDIPQAEYQARMQERAAMELKRRHQLLSQVLGRGSERRKVEEEERRQEGRRIMGIMYIKGGWKARNERLG